MRDDDRILTADGRPIRTLDDWGQARTLFRVDRPIDLEIERQGSRFHTSLVLRRADTGIFFGYTWTDRVNYFGWRGAALSLIIMSFFVFLRPYDLSARLASLAWAAVAAMLGMPMITHVPGHGWAAAWRGLPWPLAVLFAIPALSVALFPLLSFGFCAVFPRDYFSSRRRLLAWCVPSLLTVPLIFHSRAHRVVAAPGICRPAGPRPERDRLSHAGVRAGRPGAAHDAGRQQAGRSPAAAGDCQNATLNSVILPL